MSKRVGDLQVEENMRWQQKEWALSRIGWLLMLGFLLAALVGLFGTGPISLSESTAAGGGLEVTYQKYGRRGAPTELEVTIEPALITQGKFALWVDETYLHQMELENIAPQPESVEAAENHSIYTFAVDEGGPAKVTFNMTVDTIGGTDSTIGIEGGQKVSFSQFFFP